MQMSYKFRLYPSRRQEQKLLWTLDKCRFVYNQMLAGLNKQEMPNKYELKRQIPLLKEKYPELKGVYSQVLQNEVYRLFWNLKSLFQQKKNGKKVGKNVYDLDLPSIVTNEHMIMTYKIRPNYTIYHNLAGKILNASWDKFLQLLGSKAERAALVVKVNPSKPHR